MSTLHDADPVRLRLSTKPAQPAPPRAAENVKLVQRKIDQNLKTGLPGAAAGDAADRLNLPGSPGLMAQLAEPERVRLAERSDEPVAPAAPATDEAVESADWVAQAWQERMAKQWEDVTARLLRDFAPDGGADAEAVLAHIEEQRRILDSATVRDYLPVLVDRAVRRILAPEENKS